VIPPAAIYLAGLLAVPVLSGAARKTWVAGLGFLGLVAALLAGTGQPAGPYVFGPGIELVLFSVDPSRSFAGAVFAIAALLAILYSLHRDLPPVETMGILASAGAAMGIVFAGDFITVFIFWELLALASLAIIWSAPGSGGSGFRYLLFHIFGGACLLTGSAIGVVASGSTLLAPIGPGPQYLLITIGIGVNAAFVPLHTWVPDAYPRASVAGTVALSIFTTKAAVFLLVVLGGWGQGLAYMGALMAVYGAVFALFQDDIRRVLSYSVISQVGYMVAAVGTGSAMGTDAALAHMTCDIVFKALLFMAAGAVILRTGISRMSRLGGLAKTMPLTAITAVVGGLALAGVPGLSGSVSKGMVIGAATEVPYLAPLLLFAAVVTVLYTSRFLWFVFFRKAPDNLGVRVEREAPVAMLAAMGIAAGFCILIGLFPDLLVSHLPGGSVAHPFSRTHLVESGAVLLAAGIVLLIAKPLRSPSGMVCETDIDRAYCAAGRAVAWTVKNPLSSGARGIDRMIGRIVSLATRVSQNPVMTIRIWARTLALPFVRALLDPGHADQFESALDGMRKRYPDERPGIRGSGYGLILICIIAFLYYLLGAYA